MDYSKGLLYALLAALSAALVGVFGKLGMKDIDSTLATAVRSVVMTFFLLAVASWLGLWSKLGTLHGRAVLMIVLSGLAGATSWLFGFRAIQLIGVSKVAPIDKLSVPLAVVLAVIFLQERPSPTNWAGIACIALGAYLAAIK